MLCWTIVFSSCNGETDTNSEPIDLTNIPYNPSLFEIVVPDSFPIFEQPDNNLMTIDGIKLGRHLFYDPILSRDSTMSCSSCHLPEGSFTDNLNVSLGVRELPGTRSSMSLLNVGFYYNGLFWDGRARTLEEQALLPVEDALELNASWPDILVKMRSSPKYQELFRKSFGITDTDGITKEAAAKAIAQFERSLVSSGKSKFDRVRMGLAVLTDEEQLGLEIFFNRTPTLPDGECFHCHAGSLLTSNDYVNNGIVEAAEFEDYVDKGLGSISGNSIDNGKFRIPTLRNIEFSAPYMHDGSLQTLEEVIEHYNSGGKESKGKDPLIRPLGLSDTHKQALIAFLKTLNDEEFMINPEYQDPKG